MGEHEDERRALPFACAAACYKRPVLRFVAGFFAASFLWGGLLVANKLGIVELNLAPDEVEAEPIELAADEAPSDDPRGGKAKRRGKRRAGTGARQGRDPRYEGESSFGDELGGPEARNLNVAAGGGEEQLLGSEIERGFDEAMPRIRRCLILAASDEPVTGKIVFGVRISGSGRVEKVNLNGPSAITRSEAGGCLAQAARGIQFRSFNGPDMLVSFPLTLQ